MWIKREGVVSLLSVLILVTVLPLSVVSCRANTASAEMPVVKISQELIDQAIRECEDEVDWGISFFTVRSKYVVGVALEAAIVLHNGNDVARWVTLECNPRFLASTSEEDGHTYQPSPSASCQWLKPEVEAVRLQPMETKVVKVTLAVPAGVTGLPKYWEIDLKADGTPIQTYSQVVLAKSVDLVNKLTGEVTPDTIVTFHLTRPLLEGVKSVLSIVSSIADEKPYVTDYDPREGILTLDGCMSNVERTLTITYEYQSSFTGACDQRWLITMLDTK